MVLIDAARLCLLLRDIICSVALRMIRARNQAWLAHARVLRAAARDVSERVLISRLRGAVMSLRAMFVAQGAQRATRSHCR